MIDHDVQETAALMGTISERNMAEMGPIWQRI